MGEGSTRIPAASILGYERCGCDTTMTDEKDMEYFWGIFCQ